MWQALDIGKPKNGAMAEAVLAGQELLVVSIDGKLFCADNCCPHEEAKLTLGCFVGTRLRCSLHGFSFDLADGGRSDEDGVDDLQTYQVKEEGGRIWVGGKL